MTVRVGALPDGFYVEDDGPGIPEDERGSVLEAGYSTADGTGFGLAIVEQVASAHGWEIDVTEVPTAEPGSSSTASRRPMREGSRSSDPRERAW